MPYNIILFYYSSPVIIHSSQINLEPRQCAKYIFFRDIVFHIESICLCSVLNFTKVEYKNYNKTKLRSNLYFFNDIFRKYKVFVISVKFPKHRV